MGRLFPLPDKHRISWIHKSELGPTYLKVKSSQTSQTPSSVSEERGVRDEVELRVWGGLLQALRCSYWKQGWAFS